MASPYKNELGESFSQICFYMESPYNSGKSGDFK